MIFPAQKHPVCNLLFLVWSDFRRLFLSLGLRMTVHCWIQAKCWNYFRIRQPWTRLIWEYLIQWASLSGLTLLESGMLMGECLVILFMTRRCFIYHWMLWGKCQHLRNNIGVLKVNIWMLCFSLKWLFLNIIIYLSHLDIFRWNHLFLAIIVHQDMNKP